MHLSISSSHTTTASLLDSRWYGAVFGGKALELAGRVVHPEYQEQGIATTMLDNLLRATQPEFLTTYTRNPRILRMMNHVSSELYPLVDDEELKSLATTMNYAEPRGNALYHINRYDENGLFVGVDPASYPFEKDGVSLKQQFEELINVRNALVVAARVRR